MSMNALHFAGSDIWWESSDFTTALASDLMDCGAPGPADGAVAYVRQHYTVTGDPADCAAYLRGYGAWEDEDLADHESNLNRLVWLTGCALAESGNASFSTY